MPGTFQVGQLVEVTGGGKVGIPEEWRRPGKSYEGPTDFTGVRGQVVKWFEDKEHWMVATFGAVVVPVKEKNLKALSIDDVQGFDLALGPRSDSEVMGEQITTALVEKGVAVCKLFISPDDLESMCAVAEQAINDDIFVRLPLELEPGYLGRDGTGKTMSLDMDDPDLEDYIKDSQLKVIEDTFSSVGSLLRPFTADKLGHDIHSRSNTMMVLPFADDDDEEQFPPPDFENDEAASFLQTMYRAKLMVLVNAGPGTGTLTLIPKADGAVGQKVTIDPGTLAVVSSDYKYSYATEGKSLTLKCWYLDNPSSFEIKQHKDADLTNVIDLVPKGPGIPRGDPVAIVAIACRYAFGCDTPGKIWAAWRHCGIDTFCKYPRNRWDADVYYEEGAQTGIGTWKHYTCHGGFSDGIELFDNKFFDLAPMETRGMDPTQRQVLEVGYISLNGAGYEKRELMKKPLNISCFVGIDKNEWGDCPKDNAESGTGGANAITSNRFNYLLNLKGASITMDTACSASLVCTHTSKLYLLHKMWDPIPCAITVGVNLLLSPNTFAGCCMSNMISHKGRCFTYDKSADGYGRGESTASHAMKNEAYDSKEKNHWCMLAGSQVNQDGRSATMTAPNGPSQEKCLRAVLKEVNLSPPEMDATECHGTGTSLGDPIEIGAYQRVMASMPRVEPVAITTNKSNIGHCEGSAGVAGFLKCVLMAVHCEVTPNVHFANLNPHLDMNGFPACIMSEGQLYRQNSCYNGCLSFGFGGTNATAQLWAKNIMTSRAAGTKDSFKAILNKIKRAPPQEVTITGEDWETWEMDGPGRNTRLDQAWDIAILPDGTVQYLEKAAEIKDLGSCYYLISSANAWEQDEMEQDDMLDGLFSTTIQLGPSGQERFQIVADKDEEMTFYPAIPDCHWKSATVLGPQRAGTDKSWCIQGYPGEVYRIEFCKSGNDKVSVMWFKED